MCVFVCTCAHVISLCRCDLVWSTFVAWVLCLWVWPIWGQRDSILQTRRLLHCMATQTSRSMQTAPYVQSAKSRMARFIPCFFFSFLVFVCLFFVCMRVCMTTCVPVWVYVFVCVPAFECVHVVRVCVRLCNLMVIFVSEGNLFKDLYNSSLKFWFMWQK